MAVPASRYQPSPRPFVETVAPFDYSDGDLVRRVQSGGRISLFGKVLRLPKAFHGKDIAMRPAEQDGVFDAYFRHQYVTTIHLAGLD